MIEPKEGWQGKEWLNRCAWCETAIGPGREVLALKARLRPEAVKTPETGRVQPLVLTHADKTVPVILPAHGAAANQQGIDAAFQVCSNKCAEALQEALRQEPEFAQVDLFHPTEVVSPELAKKSKFPSLLGGELPPGALASAQGSMETMLRQVLRAIEQRNLQTPEAVNNFLDSIGPDSEFFKVPLPPSEQAQVLVHAAYDEPSRKKRAKLAKRALRIDPDCADACLVLAEDADSLETEKELCEKALQAAERALGPEALRNYAGRFWTIPETRPYMRARWALATCLWDMGEHAAAIGHFQVMLELNPNDHQGIRYVLADWLLAENRDAELDALLQRYPEDATAPWSYDRALLLFRQGGPSRKAREALERAIKHNPYVPAYLLQKKKIPGTPPADIGIGDESEAVVYAHDALKGWLETPKALEWLAETAGEAALGIQGSRASDAR